jgi:hypothetical protein
VTANKRVSPNRSIERNAVNAVRYFFEDHNVPFFEVDLRVDFGKDAAIEVVDGDVSTGVWVGLQVKGGEQTVRVKEGRTARGVPFSAKDCKSFRCSNIPVIGIVRGNEDAVDRFLWVNLRKFCQELFEAHGEDKGGFAQTERMLNEYHLRAFLEEMRTVATSDHGSPTLQLVSDDPEVQQQAVFDCFVLAQSDPRPMIVARRLLTFLSREAIYTLILALTPIVGHGDVFYSPRNIRPESIRRTISASLRWSPSEMALLLGFLTEDEEEEMWGRGTFGQSICAIVSEPRNSLANLVLLAEDRKSFPVFVRRRAYILALYLAGDDAPVISSRIMRHSYDLAEDEDVRVVIEQVREFGYLELY